jgi:tripartite-type tricarboxylate transporter receptor subunit TctC
MKNHGKKLFKVIAMGAILFVNVTFMPSLSQGSQNFKWPEKDIVIIVPYRPGGGYDINARIIAQFIMKHLPNKVNVIVKNVPGAEAKIGTLEMATSNPDGYTLALGDPVQLGTMEKQGGLKSMKPKDFAYLGQIYAPCSLMVVNASGRFKKIEDMRDQDVSFGMLGDNTLVNIIVAKALGAKPTLVAYNSTPEGCMAVARGDLDVWISAAATANKQINTFKGKLMPFMLIGGKPDALPSDIKTATELGLRIDESIGLKRVIVIGPPGIESQVQEILSEAVFKAASDPEAQAQMRKAGYRAEPLVGEELMREVKKIYALTDEYESLIPKKN